MCRSRKYYIANSTSKNAAIRSTATFDWNHREVIPGDIFRICNDSLCEAVGGCGCPDTDIYQFIRIWNSTTMEYEEICVSIDECMK